MSYPLISEYIESIKFAKENFEELKDLRPVLDEDGQPVMSSGNFAVVFKMKDEQTGKLHAVKCFLKEQEGRAEAYHMIAEELEYVNSTFLTPIRYLDKELFVDTNTSDETEFPVLLMDWVEGLTLDKYIREHIDDQYELSMLAYQFSRLAMWLMPQPFAHGDLKPDNIIVKDDGTLVLVDYDGMYVSAMKGQRARELGSTDFRHPNRTEEDFDEHFDDFSLASILLSLKAISLQPKFLEQYGASDRLLFSEKDYQNLSNSGVLGAMQHLMQDAELASLYSLFILALSQNNLSQVSFRLFNLKRPDKSQYEEENLSTLVTDEDLASAWTDEYGVMYSSDRKRLLRAPREIGCYSVRNGTKIICNNSFESTLLAQVFISNSVLCIGDNAFSGCRLTSIDIPNTVVSIGEWAFSHNKINSLIIPKNVKYIGRGILGSCGNITKISVDNENKFFDSRNECNAIIVTKTDTLIVGCQNTIIPNDVKSIGEWAFLGCYNLSFISIPKEVLYIGLRAFDGCDRLKRISVDKDNEIFDSRNDCNAIIETKTNTLIVGCQNTIIPNNVTTIGEWAFSRCKKLSTISLPDSVLRINEGAFMGCSGLSTINLPKGLKEIGRSAFSDSGIESILIPDGIKVVSESLFNCCRRLISVSIPNSVTSIEKNAFSQCRPLSSISMSDNVISIGDCAFACCSSLTSIELPNSVQNIGKGAFYACESLKIFFIPSGAREKFEELLPEFKHILLEKDLNEKNLSTEVTEDELKNAWIDEYGVIYSIDGSRLFSAPQDLYLKEYTIKSDTEIICNNAFSGHTELLKINFPNGIKAIGDGAFSCCESIVSLKLPESIVEISKYAFEWCSQLRSINLSKNIVIIKEGAFYACDSLTSIYIPLNVRVIENGAFYKCSSLKEITIPKNVAYIEEGAFDNCMNLKTVYINNGDIKINSDAFSRCDNLSSIYVPIGTRNRFELSLDNYSGIIHEQQF